MPRIEDPVPAIVKVRDGKHICDPLPIRVNPGNTIAWLNEFPLVFDPSPFVKNETVVRPNGKSKIREDVKKGSRFSGVVQTPNGPVDLHGEIIVVGPD
jgi:hypothetical protein